MSEGSGQGYVVRDDDLRLGQGSQRFDEVRSSRRIEKGSGLVEQDHLGLHSQDAGKSGQAFLTSAEVVRWALTQAAEPDGRERLADAPEYFVLLVPRVGGTKGYIFRNSRHKQLVVGVLEKQPDLTSSEGDVRAIHWSSDDLDASLPVKQTDEEMEKGRLAGAVWSQQGNRFAFFQEEVDARQSLGSVGVPKAEIFDL